MSTSGVAGVVILAGLAAPLAAACLSGAVRAGLDRLARLLAIGAVYSEGIVSADAPEGPTTSGRDDMRGPKS